MNSFVLEFAVLQEASDDADNLPALVQRRVGHGTHQAGAAAAVDKRDPAAGEFFAKLLGGKRVVGSPADAGAAEDTETGEWSGGWSGWW